MALWRLSESLWRSLGLDLGAVSVQGQGQETLAANKYVMK